MRRTYWSGRVAPTLSAIGLAMAVPFGAAIAQVGQPAPSIQPVPDDLELAKLVWSTMAAIEHANQSGNYSVLRDISAPGFQIQNDAARLAQIFASIRASRVDLSNALLLAPTYTTPPQILQGGVMRVQGLFGLRPTAIGFDFYFQWVQGRWRLFGVSITPSTIAAMQPDTSRPPSQQPIRVPPARR